MAKRTIKKATEKPEIKVEVQEKKFKTGLIKIRNGIKKNWKKAACIAGAFAAGAAVVALGSKAPQYRDFDTDSDPEDGEDYDSYTEVDDEDGDEETE